MWLLDSVWIWGLSAASIVAVLLLERRESQRGGWVPVVSAGLALLRALLGALTFEGWEYAGHGWLDNAVTFGAHLFLMGVPALRAGLALACSRLRRRWVKAVLILAFLAVFPFFSGMQRDGGIPHLFRCPVRHHLSAPPPVHRGTALCDGNRGAAFSFGRGFPVEPVLTRKEAAAMAGVSTKTITTNKKAFHEYFVEESMEAGSS